MTDQRRVYLSGPMTGIEDWNYPAFHDTAYRLRERGLLVFNPAEAFNGDTTLDWTHYMRADIEALMNCDQVVVLPGWAQSLGAIIEVACALAMGLSVTDTELRPIFQSDDPRASVTQVLSLLHRPATRPQQPTPEQPRSDSILLEAHGLVHGDRQDDYGHPLDDFTKTATIWSAILGVDVTPEQVALCMIGVKISRQVNKPKRDNVVDLAGYAETLEMVISEKARRDAL